MSVPPRVQRHRKAEAARRKVRTVGKRAPRPRATKPPVRRPKYRKSAALGGLSGMFGALFIATGQIFWAVGAVASSSGAAAAAYIDYRRDLIEVKRTGKPVGAPGPSLPPKQSQTLARRPPDARKKPPGAASADHPLPGKGKPAVTPLHPGCRASAPRYCRCPGGPNRRGATKGKTTTTKPATRTRKK